MLLTWKQNSGAFLNILFSFDPRGRGAGGGGVGGGGDNGLCGEVPPKRGTVLGFIKKA